MRPSTAFVLFKADPEAFLRNNGLQITGGNIDGPDYYTIGHSIFAWANAGGNVPNEVMGMAPASAGGMGQQETMLTGLHLFPAYNVRMIPDNQAVDYANIPNCHLTGAGPDVMATGILTGCTMVFQANAANTDVRVAHIEPGGMRQSATYEEAQLRFNAQLNGAAATHFFGPSDYDHSHNAASVIGLRTGGVWAIYAQIFNRNPRYVRDVVQIL